MSFLVLLLILGTWVTTVASNEPCCSLENGVEGFYWSSPGFGVGEYYPNKFRCTVGASTETPHQTLYTLNSFSLQKKKKIKKKKRCIDAVRIKLPSSRVLSLCGRKNGIIRVPNFRFQNVFVSNRNKNSQGFNITISAVKTACHQVIDLTSGNLTKGFITTPRFPNKFPKYSQCEWWIKAPEGRQIQLNIQWLSIKWSKRCSAAYLVVDKNGDKTYPAKTSQRLCGKSQGVSVTSTGDSLNVVFDGGKKRDRGLRARYRVI